MRTAVIIPLRSRHGGKSRLSPVLAPLERSALVESMARHVVSVILETAVTGPVFLVTRDPDVDWLPDRPDRRFQVLRQASTDHPGLNPAIEIGRQAALARAADRLLVVSADLPLLTTADVGQFLDSRAMVTIAPDRSGSGTNAILLSSPTAITGFRFHFGIDSRRRHEAEAAAQSLDHACIETPGFQLDLDTPVEWAMLSAEAREHLLRPSEHAPAARAAGLLLETA